MPVYEYKCESCGEKTQMLQRVDEDSSGETCPVCRKGKLQKIFSLFSSSSGSETSSCSTDTSSPFT